MSFNIQGTYDYARKNGVDTSKWGTKDDRSHLIDYDSSAPASRPSVPSNNSFEYKPYQPPSYNAMSYGDAQNRAQQQMDPIYTRALENVRASIQPSKLDADQVAAARGGLHSGLAADLQNKVQINANSKMADLQGDQASKIAQLAQAMIDNDRNQQNMIQQQALQRWMAENNQISQMNEFDYRSSQDNRLMDYNLWNSWNTQNPSGVTAYHDFINYLRNGR